MKTQIISLSVILMLVLSAFTIGSWSVDTDNSKAAFSITNMGMSVNGTFDSGVTGKVTFDAEDLAGSSITAEVATKTINTGIEMRDKHLRNEDYFEVDTYPNITFTSTEFGTGKDGGHTVTGDFTIKKTTKKVTIPFTFENNTFKGSFNINRLDYDLGEKSWVMKNDVKISFTIPVK